MTFTRNEVRGTQFFQKRRFQGFISEDFKVSCRSLGENRVHTHPGKPGNVLECRLVLEKILEFFKNKDLSWKNKLSSIFFILHNYMIGDSMMRQQNVFSLLSIYFL